MTQFYDKCPHTIEKTQSNVTTQKRHQKLPNTQIADRLRTVSLSNDSDLTDVVKPVNGIPAFLLTAINQKDTL